MTITIPLPDWGVWQQWLQTPLQPGCSVCYWHIVAAAVYWLVSYVVVLTFFFTTRSPPDSKDTRAGIVFSPVMAPFLLVFWLGATVSWLLLLPLKLANRVSGRSDCG
jgi:hypothetical protein